MDTLFERVDTSLDRRLRIVQQAIIARQSLSAHCGGYAMHFTPRIIGRDRSGALVVAGYQYGGERPGGLPPCGAWCRLPLVPLEDLALNKDPWSPGPSGIPASFGDIELTDYWLEMRPY